MRTAHYFRGLKTGIPVGLGYFSVSFGFGALAAAQGVRVIDATLISVTNLTSAGQFAGLTLIVAAAGLWEMILTMLVINSRYALMSLALSQRMGESIGLLPRLAVAFFNTDEIFALAMERTKALTISYMLGLASLPILGWVSGTFCGAAASSVLPLSVRTALGVALYGMFVAIVVPQARKEKPFLITAGIAAALSCMMEWIPLFQSISDGIAIVLSTVIAAAICAVAFPVEEKKEAAK